MRTKSLIVVYIMAIIFLNTVPLKADLIVDTSAGMTIGEKIMEGTVLDAYQWLAQKIFLPQAYTITQVQGILGAIHLDGDIRAAIRSDSGAIPGNILFSQVFTSSTPRIYTWQGPSNLSWILSAGTYWLAFEVLSSSTFDGAMETKTPKDFYGSANSSPREPTIYTANNSFEIGIRVYGDLSPVDNPIINPPPAMFPIPSTIMLLVTGLGLLVLFTRRKKPPAH